MKVSVGHRLRRDRADVTPEAMTYHGCIFKLSTLYQRQVDHIGRCEQQGTAVSVGRHTVL